MNTRTLAAALAGATLFGLTAQAAPKAKPKANPAVYAMVGSRTTFGVLNVYKSKFAGTNKATAATWVVGDRIGDVVDTLRSKGVVFEHYNLPGLKREGDIHVGEGMRVAWFKDPDGNIFNLVSG